MPPKAARGGTGRGRGRGRGKASASVTSAPQTNPEDSTANPKDTIGEATSSTAPHFDPPVSQTSANEDLAPSPNSSPATIPTETPAPTPLRVNPASASIDSSEVTQAGPSVRGGLVSRGRGGARGRGAPEAVTKSKFKPKIIRRNVDEREEAARQEQIRLDGISSAAARAAARAARGRGRGGRGRGDAMGRGMVRSGTAGGIFGVVPEGLGKAPGFIMRRDAGGGGGGADGPRIIKSEGFVHSSGGGGGSGRGGGQDGGHWFEEPEYPDDDINAPRVDIELINISDDDDPVIVGTSNKQRNGNGGHSHSGGLKPIRLQREEHKARVAIVNTEPVAKEEPVESDDELPTIDEWKSSHVEDGQGNELDVPPDHDELDVRIKHEPGLEIPLRAPTRDPSEPLVPDSPDTQRNRKDLVDPSSAMAKELNKKARRPKRKEKMPVMQTEEDKEEYERHLQDVAILAAELGGMNGNLGDKERDKEGDTTMGETEDAPDTDDKDRLAGRLYLFQFPPVLPQLYNPITEAKPLSKMSLAQEIERKKEEIKDEKGKDVDMANIPDKPKPRSAMKQPIDLTGSASAPEVKIEPNTGLTAADLRRLEEEKKGKRKEVVHEGGWIGKLIVRESGKIELSWGGTNLVLSRGVPTNFLSSGVVVDTAEVGPPGGGVPEGKALGMGPIMGKFIVTPEWDKMT